MLAYTDFKDIGAWLSIARRLRYVQHDVAGRLLFPNRPSGTHEQPAQVHFHVHHPGTAQHQCADFGISI